MNELVSTQSKKKLTEALNEIVSGSNVSGTWFERRDEIIDYMKEADDGERMLGALEEFVSWFSGEMP